MAETKVSSPPAETSASSPTPESKPQSSYRQILKATSLFGGVQLFIVITAAVKAKFVAVILGPAGMGVVGLLTSTTTFVGKLTESGLSISAVRNVSAANAEDDMEQVAEVVQVLRQLVWFTGLLGTIIVFALAPWLSELTFGHGDYTAAFRWISVTLLLGQLSKGQKVVIQGLRRINHLAKANLFGSLAGLLVSIPVYIVWGMEGIVPVILLTAVFTILSSWYFARKVKLPSVKIDWEKIKKHGGSMLHMGILLSLNSMIGMSASYALKIFISRAGSVADVGLFNAGYTLTTIYVGMVFTGIMTDFFPRLSGVSGDDKKANQLVNQQAEVAVMLIAPILAGTIVFMDLIMPILFSNKFLVVAPMVQWMEMGLYFKSLSYSIILIFLARGETRTFFWNEVSWCGYNLVLNVIGYYYGGLDGLGFSFFISHFLYFIHIMTLVRLKSTFRLELRTLGLFGIQLALGALCFAGSAFLPPLFSYLAGSLLAAGSVVLSFRVLSEKMGLKQLLREKFSRFYKN